MPRPRLHKSSVVVGIMVSIILLLIMVPGRIVDGIPWGWMTLEHGWPFNFLRRQAKGNAPDPGTFNIYRIRAIDVEHRPMWGIPWLSADNWRFWEAITDITRNDKRIRYWEFNGIALACDLAIAPVVLAIVVPMWELRQRRRPGLFRFTLSDMLFAVASLSTVLGWLVYQQRESRREERLMDAEDERIWDNHLTDYWSGDDEVCIAPVFVRSLVGERLMPAFLWRTCEIDLYLEDGVRANVICAELSRLDHVTRVELLNDSSQRFPYAALRSLKRLNTLEIYDEVDERVISELAQLTQLKRIVIDFEEEIRADMLKQLKAALPDCTIIDSSDDW